MAGKKTGKKRGRQAKQQQLAFSEGQWGGCRPGAGRRPKGEKAGIPHKVRARMNKSTPMHVTARPRGGLQGLFVRIAKALNKLWGRRGSVFADRYHDHVLGTPTSTRPGGGSMAGGRPWP